MKKLQLLILLSILILSNTAMYGQVYVGIETGVITDQYNNARVPGNTGSYFELPEQFGNITKPYFRARMTIPFKERHFLSILFAPVEFDYEGSFDRDINFKNTIFPEDSSVTAKYIFDTYRLTYRYDFVRNEKIQAGLGITALVRQAKISVETADMERIESNTGFVPLLNFRFAYAFSKNYGLLISGDALASPNGRAEDVLAAITYTPGKGLMLHGGYRLLEGGSDNDDVYTFAYFHHLAFGLRMEI